MKRKLASLLTFLEIENVTVQKTDITYKAGKIIAPTLDTEDPIRTVLAFN